MSERLKKVTHALEDYQVQTDMQEDTVVILVMQGNTDCVGQHRVPARS